MKVALINNEEGGISLVYKSLGENLAMKRIDSAIFTGRLSLRALAPKFCYA